MRIIQTRMGNMIAHSFDAFMVGHGSSEDLSCGLICGVIEVILALESVRLGTE
jgi:hypothetical protein